MAPTQRRKVRPTSKLNNSTIRDFSGGLNVVDNEQNLTSRFAPVFDNVVTHNDRRAGVRFGYAMIKKLKGGTTQSGTTTKTFSASDDSRVLTIPWTAHPFSIGGAAQALQHITISNASAGVENIPASDIGSTIPVTHGLRVIDANTIAIIVPTEATSTGTNSITFNWISDTHMLGGKSVDARYFANYVILVTSAGEIIRLDKDMNAERIWSNSIAYALAGGPIAWSYTDLVAWDVFSGQLLLSNGRDKMLYIDFDETIPVNYKTDPGNSGSNDKIDPFDACKSAFRYFTMHSTKAGFETQIRISAKNAEEVYSDSPTPGDAVDVNIGNLLASSDVTVRAFAVMKDTLLAIMPNSTVMLRYGILNSNDVHDPDPVDTITGFGTGSMRSVVEVGSEVFMIDYNGMPSAKLSTVATRTVIPTRISDNIETMTSKHIGRLSKETMRLKAFGIWDGKNKALHFCLPKFDDDDSTNIPRDPFFYSEVLHGKTQLIMWFPNHNTEVGDFLSIIGAIDVGAVTAANINGTREVVGVIDENYIIINIGTTIISGDGAGGGTNIIAKRVNDETITYFYRYIPAIRVFAWSRFKGMKFACGCGTVEGRVIMFDDDGYVFRYGSPDAPVHADWYGMYDFASWTSSQTYSKGSRVYDATDGAVYIAVVETSNDAATFAEARAENDDWIVYEGQPIEFAHELPWADFGIRQNEKALRFFHADAVGQSQFTVDLFVDNQYIDQQTGLPQPARSMQFTPNDSPGFGAGNQPFGGGRRTREQSLWSIPVKFKLLKVRIRGASTRKLDITSLSFLYHKGLMIRG